MQKKEAFAPPFAVGTRVMYVGTYSWSRGQSGLMVSPGDIGTVIEVRPGLDAHPDVFGQEDEPIDGWSVVEFNGVNRAAVSRGNPQYRRAR